MTTAISATRRQVRELVDGTLEVRIHIDPTFKRAFYDLFPDIDTPVALAPLKPDFAQPSAVYHVTPADPEEWRKQNLKGGPLAKLAGMFCNDPKFWEWAMTLDPFQHGFSRISVTSADDARTFILEMCNGIASRRELDHDSNAAGVFHELIRLPYSNWLDKQRT